MIPKKSTPFVLLLVGILLTLLAVLGHRFLPERRLSIDSSHPEAKFFLLTEGSGAPSDLHWIDQSRLHYGCRFPAAPAWQGCGLAYLLSSDDLSKGMDLSRYRTLNVSIRYTGKAQYLRIGIRNFDPRFSKLEDQNSPKFNFVNIPARDLAQPIAISLNEFAVAEWWSTFYKLPREYSLPDLTNATVINLDLQGELAGSMNDIRIDRMEFVGDWISAEYWYLGILCLWMVAGTAYGISQWLVLARAHREQRLVIRDLETEKEKFEKLSTIDALTNVLNRHGIDQYVNSLGKSQPQASVIVIDLDHFKRINDQRGHHMGDRVLRTLGEVLRSGTRETDGLGRWGGEEFVLVCPGTSLAKAAELAEKLRRRIMDTNFIPEDPLPVTASFGVAISQPEQPFEDAFRRADEALYLAKSRGRNCVVAAADDQMLRMTGASKGTWAMLSGRFRLHK